MQPPLVSNPVLPVGFRKELPLNKPLFFSFFSQPEWSDKGGGVRGAMFAIKDTP